MSARTPLPSNVACATAAIPPRLLARGTAPSPPAAPPRMLGLFAISPSTIAAEPTSAVAFLVPLDGEGAARGEAMRPCGECSATITAGPYNLAEFLVSLDGEEWERGDCVATSMLPPGLEKIGMG